MRTFKDNLLIQFSIVSLVVMLILALTLSAMLTDRMNRNIGLLREHGTVMMAGGMIRNADTYSIPSLTNNVRILQRDTYAAVGSGFVILYFGLVYIVWRGWVTINRQRSDLQRANHELQETYHDIQAANDEIQAAQEKLVRAEKLAAIGELAAGVAHEIRNPLGAINNAVYYIKDKLKGSELVEQYPRIGQFLGVMDQEIESSNRIITDLMDFARVKPPDLLLTNVEELIDSAIARIPIKENVTVAKEIDSSDLSVFVDEEQMRRVLMNLIKNADEAMPEGGDIVVRARQIDESMEIEVRDSGRGINEADLPKLFEPLFTTKAKGIGLGLAIVHELVRKNKGEIRVSSAPGQGAVFTMMLPIKSAQEVSSSGVRHE